MHLIDQVWRVSYYSCIPTNYLVDRFTIWRTAERFYAEYFGFFFDNTSACYLVLEQELGELRCIGQIRFGGSLAIHVSQLIVQWIDLPFRGRWRGFTLSISVSSSITHRRVILCLHSSSLLFQLSFYYCILMNMAWHSFIICSLSFTLFRTQFK